MTQAAGTQGNARSTNQEEVRQAIEDAQRAVQDAARSAREASRNAQQAAEAGQVQAVGFDIQKRQSEHPLHPQISGARNRSQDAGDLLSQAL